MNLNKEIQDLAKTNGIFYCGAADLSLAKEFIIHQGGNELRDYPFSISLGITLFKNIVDMLPDRCTIGNIKYYNEIKVRELYCLC